MKIIKNTSMQGFSVPFITPEGVKHRHVGSKQTLEVPDSWGGKVLDNLVKRRLFKVRIVDESAPKIPSTVKTVGRKTEEKEIKKSDK